MQLDADGLTNPILIRVGYALLHFLWQGILMAGITSAGLRLLRQATSSQRYLYLLTMFGVLTLLPPVTFLLVDNPNFELSQALPDEQTLTENFDVPPENLPSLEYAPVPVVAVDTVIVTDEPDDLEPSALPGYANGNSQRVLGFLVLVWAVGVCLLSLRLVFGWIMMMRVRRTGLSAIQTHVQAMCTSLCSSMPVRKSVQVFESAIVQVPAVVGWLRPLILVPAKFVTGLSDEELRAILAHELAHIRRRDYLVNLGQIFVENLLFYHPVVWWLSSRIRQEREYCCDDIAAEVCGSRVMIARALATLAELDARTPTMLPAATGGSLIHRIRRLLQTAAKPERMDCGGIGIGILCLVLPLIVASSLAVSTADLADADDSSGSSVANISEDQVEVLTEKQEKKSISSKESESEAGKAVNPFDETPTNHTVQIEDETAGDSSTKLGRSTHESAASIDPLPRFYWASDNGTLATFVLSDPSKDPLDNLIRSLDAPDGGAKWFQYHAQFGWDENHYIEATGGTDTDQVSQFYWGTRELAGVRTGRGDVLQHVLMKDAATMWMDHRLSYPNYILFTRHAFWWGETGDHGKLLAGTGIPPGMADYEQLPDKTFDGELCHIIQSKARQEMLLISNASGLLRGYVLIRPSGYPDEFYKSEEVKKITGVEFSSQHEHTNWFRENESKMSDQARWELVKSWSLACDWSTPAASLLVRFRDYREIAPGIMWPFHEDRVQGSMRNEKFECMRSYCHVHEVAVDRDMTEKVNALRPKDGEQIQDQRFPAIVNYKFSKDRENAEIMKLVDEAFERQMKDQRIVEQAKKPYEAMIGKPAPKLPEQNWVGGHRPELEGKPYLIHFWATWCGPCKNDLPRLKRFSDSGGPVIGMHPGGTAADEVTTAIQAAELGYPTYVSPETSSSQNPTIAGYPATIYPYCVLVDGKGRVVAHGTLRDDKFDVLAQYRELVKSGVSNSPAKPHDEPR